MRDQPQRDGFTLIEMLVALAIIMLLAALTVTFLNFQEKKVATDGAGRLQGWLMSAQQWALRDQAPRGLRLLPPTSVSQTALSAGAGQTVTPSSMYGIATGTLVMIDLGANAETVQVTSATATNFQATLAKPHNANVPIVAQSYVSSCQYIEQPEDFTGGYLQYDSTANPNRWIGYASYDTTGTGAVTDFSGGFYGYDSSNWPVQAGDYLEIQGGGTNASHVYSIQLLTNSFGDTAHPMNYLMIAPSHVPDVSPQFTNYYRIVRRARPRRGEAPVQVPDNVVIDLRTNGPSPWYGNPLPVNPYTGSFDIVFGPSGSVVGMGSGNDKIQLWVRDLREDQPQTHTFGGDQAIVTVYVRTGMVRVSRVNTTIDTGDSTRYGNPYAFTQDSVSAPP